MNKIVINDDDIKPDTVVKKARAIVLNEFNNIYICNMNGTYMLPGGTIEETELPIDALKRELNEELGLLNYSIQELVQIDYYHHNFPKYKSDLFENRLNQVYYYLVKINSNKIGITNFTNYEKEQNIEIEELKILEIYQKISQDSSNKYSKFTNREIKEILDYYNKGNITT